MCSSQLLQPTNIKFRYEWANFGHLHKRNEAAGVNNCFLGYFQFFSLQVTNSIIDSAVAAFILEVSLL